MPLDELFKPWNAIYSIPLAFVLIFLAITSVLGLLGGVFGELTQGDSQPDVHAEAHHDAGVDTDVDTHVDTDVDTDIDVHAETHVHTDACFHSGGELHHDAGIGADTDAGADLDGDGEISIAEQAEAVARGVANPSHPGLLVPALVALGVGRAPLVMLLQILLLFWGLIGLALHQLAGAGPFSLLWSLPATFALSILATRSFAVLFGRFFKQYESAAVSRHQLVGRTGRVVYPVTSEEGTIHVRDQHGTLHRVRARSQHGALESGQEIIILGYDPDRKTYQVDDASTFVDRA